MNDGGPGRVPAEVSFLDPWVVAGVFEPAEVHLAAWAARTVPSASTDELLALALAARGPRLGHVCTLLSEAPRTVGFDDSGDTADLPLWPEPDAWLEQLARSELVATPDVLSSPAGEPTRPLVLDGDRLYLHRYWVHELTIAASIERRAAVGVVNKGWTEPELVAALDRAFGTGGAGGEPDLQREAASCALGSRLAVIAGGPGTGKTRTVARFLVALTDLGGGMVDRIALAAPTGKASTRMGSALTSALGELRGSSTVPAGVLDALAQLEPRTVHKLLGWLPGGHFRHNRKNPLPHDVVVIDEASMMAAGLMAHLLSAVRDDATLVLVGDPGQLASVEAGAVFGDLVAAAEAGAGSSTPLSRCTTQLDRVHRFGAESGIAALAAAVRTGGSDAVISELQAGHSDVVWVDADPIDGQEMAAVQRRLVDVGVEVVRAARDGDADAALEAAGSTKVLCATRRGPNGMRDWSERIERSIDAREHMGRGARFYVGRPVLVTRNDPVSGVVNGDVGVVMAPDESAEIAKPVVIDGGGVDKVVSASRLSDTETWWAMTIHKSQGSEFRDVVVALPTVESPILTRELFYTGITRARERVTVVATEAAIRGAVERPVSRASGLRQRLS